MTPRPEVRGCVELGRSPGLQAGASSTTSERGRNQMLSKTDNELLCRIGPGTPMGNFMREYWIPAVRSDELPSPECPPLRVMLLCEPLIAFRSTSGAVGLMQNSC